MAAVVGTGLMLVLMYHLGGRAASWLAEQPPYQLAYDQIELIPEPPAAIRLRAVELLRRVRDRAGRGGDISVLAIDREELAREFGKHTPWIKRVKSIESAYPNRLVVEVEYREPVAITRAENGAWIDLDREAYVLPGDEIDRKHVPDLIVIQGLIGPLETRPGLRIAPPANPKAEQLAASTARLAGFFLDHASQVGEGGLPPVRWIMVDPSGSGLLAGLDLNGDRNDDLWIDWGAAPGDEPPGFPDSDAKWSMLLEWAGRVDRPQLPPRTRLEFTPQGLRRRGSG